jgi:hypothetical protein
MSEYEIVGPFETHRVIVGGRRVPFLQAHPMNGGRISLILDNRLGVDVSVADAETVIPFIADCIAVALGYTCHPQADQEPTPSVPFPRTHRAEVVYGEPGISSAGR